MSSTRLRVRLGPATEATRETALVLIGHGSSRSPDPLRLLETHAQALRESGLFADVGVAALSGDSNRAQITSRLRGDELHVMPMFMCDGQFASSSIAAIIRDERRGRARPITVHRPLGLIPGLAEALVSRSLDCAVRSGISSDEAILVLVAHGSNRESASRQVTGMIAAEARAAATFAAVTVAYLEERPRLREMIESLMRPAVVSGLFVAEGPHSDKEVPETLEKCSGRLVRYSGAVGSDPIIPGLILREIENSRGRNCALEGFCC